MSSSQLKDLTVEELLHYAQANAQEAEERARATTRRATIAETARARTRTTCLRCAEEAVQAARAAESALAELEELAAEEEAEEAEAEVATALTLVAAKRAATKRAETLAYFDIAHKERMLGEWSDEIQKEAVEAVKQKTSDIFDTGILEDWDAAGKLSKRRIRKTKMKTKRRRQKITKRRRRK